MSELAFRKMHGLGNDFVVLDARSAAPPMTPFIAAAIADRHTGVGCDQLIVIEPADNASARAFMRIFNPDGSEAEACGNAARCVAALLMHETETDRLTLETRAGLLQAETAGGGLVRIDMGEARLDWRDIPLARQLDTLHVPLADTLPDAVCTSMGNPHATIFVADADAIDLERLGPGLERHTLFPARANIAFASLLGPGRLRVRVWERGAGATLACGSGACAALVAAARRGLTGRHAEIVMEQGSLAIEWRADNHVLMTGPVATSFSGTLDLRSLGSAVAA